VGEWGVQGVVARVGVKAWGKEERVRGGEG